MQDYLLKRWVSVSFLNKNYCRFAQERPLLLTAEYFDAIEWFDETRETPDTELAELPPFLRLKSPPRTPFFFAFGVSKCEALYYVTKLSSKCLQCHQRWERWVTKFLNHHLCHRVDSKLVRHLEQNHHVPQHDPSPLQKVVLKMFAEYNRECSLCQKKCSPHTFRNTRVICCF